MNQEATEVIALISGKTVDVSSVNTVGGGCISSSYKVSTSEGSYFIKKASGREIAFLKCEERGLQELQLCKDIRTPQCLGFTEFDGSGYLLLEYLELTRHNSKSQRSLGKHLALMHKITAEKHGFHEDNFIGSHPQINDWYDEWIEFFINCRLMPQANDTGDQIIIQKAGKLSSRLNDFFDGYSPQPSLLHGDLWGGNSSALRDETPVIFDPAVYYGDRETDIAFTEMFGGFTSKFYRSYNEEFPLNKGYRIRKDLYQLYHYLNHANIFGGSYLSSSNRILDNLLNH